MALFLRLLPATSSHLTVFTSFLCLYNRCCAFFVIFIAVGVIVLVTVNNPILLFSFSHFVFSFLHLFSFLVSLLSSFLSSNCKIALLSLFFTMLLLPWLFVLIFFWFFILLLLLLFLSKSSSSFLFFLKKRGKKIPIQLSFTAV